MRNPSPQQLASRPSSPQLEKSLYSIKDPAQSKKEKNPPAMRETSVQSLGQEDTPKKQTASPSSILAWEIPWTEEPGGLQSMGSQSLTRLSE